MPKIRKDTVTFSCGCSLSIKSLLTSCHKKSSLVFNLGHLCQFLIKFNNQCVQMEANLSLMILFLLSTEEANTFKGSKFVHRIDSEFVQSYFLSDKL